MPAEVVYRAAALGMSAMAITDHDTVDGVPEAEATALAANMGFLRGIEISASYQGVEVHVVGLGIQPSCAALADTLERLGKSRAQRAETMVARLVAMGVPVNRERLLADAGEGTIGRVHLAREIHAAGCAKTVQEAFDKYVSQGRPAFVQRERPSCDEAIAAIHEAGGLAFLGHPGIGQVAKIVSALLGLPFDGIEAYHTKHTGDQTAEYLELAKDRGLLISGGSDCHGAAKRAEPEMGKVRVPYAHYERLLAALGVR